MNQITVFIVSPGQDRAKDWANQQGLANHPAFRWHYVYDPFDLQGYRRPMVFMLPGWWNRPDADELRGQLMARGAVCIHTSEEVT